MGKIRSLCADKWGKQEAFLLINEENKKLMGR